MMFPAVQPHQFEDFLRAGQALLFGHALHLQPVGHVVDDAAVAEEAEALEDHAHGVAAQLTQLALAQPGHIRAVDDNGAARRLDEPRQAADERGFSRTGEPHDHEDFAVVDLERDIAHGEDVAGPLQHFSARHFRRDGVGNVRRRRAEDFPYMLTGDFDWFHVESRRRGLGR